MGPKYTSSDVVAWMWSHLLIWSLQGVAGTRTSLGSDGKESIYNAGDRGLIPELGRPPGEGNGNPLQYSCLENSMTGRGVAKSQTQHTHTHTHTYTHTHLVWLNVYLQTFSAGKPDSFAI